MSDSTHGPNLNRVKCPICGKSLSPRTDMVRHGKLHASHEERAEFMYSCSFPDCNFQSLQKSNVDTHYRRHSREKSLACPDETCDFTTGDPASLTRHRKSKHNYQPPPRNYLRKSSRATKRRAARHAPYRIERESSCESVSSLSSLSSTSSTTDSDDLTSFGPYSSSVTSASSSQSSLALDLKDAESLAVTCADVPSRLLSHWQSSRPHDSDDWCMPMTHDQDNWQMTFDQLCSHESSSLSNFSMSPAVLLARTAPSWESLPSLSSEMRYLPPYGSLAGSAVYPNVSSVTSSRQSSLPCPGWSYSSPLSTALVHVPDGRFVSGISASYYGSSRPLVNCISARENTFLDASATFVRLSSPPMDPELSAFLEQLDPPSEVMFGSTPIVNFDCPGDCVVTLLEVSGFDLQ